LIWNPIVSPYQKYPFHLPAFRFDQIKNVNPAGARIPVFIGPVPGIGPVHGACEVLGVQVLDVLPRRVIDPQTVFPRVLVVSNKNGNRFVRGRIKKIFINIKNVDRRGCKSKGRGDGVGVGGR
jgi:hypothetical protein